MSSPRRRVLAGAGAVLAAIALSACSDNSIADEAKQGDQKGYIAGDGKTELIPVARRGEPVALAGTTLDGVSWESTSQRDKLLVVNVWASWCGPCDKEAPDLVAVSSDPAITAQARFVGINFREQAVTGRSQAKAWKLPYPNLSDPGGTAILTLQGKANAMPSTLILDREGRIAARISGPITASTLTGMIEDVAAESSGS